MHAVPPFPPLFAECVSKAPFRRIQTRSINAAINVAPTIFSNGKEFGLHSVRAVVAQSVTAIIPYHIFTLTRQPVAPGNPVVQWVTSLPSYAWFVISHPDERDYFSHVKVPGEAIISLFREQTKIVSKKKIVGERGKKGEEGRQRAGWSNPFSLFAIKTKASSAEESWRKKIVDLRPSGGIKGRAPNSCRNRMTVIQNGGDGSTHERTDTHTHTWRKWS